MYGEEARDEIRIENLEIYAYHGVYAGERKKGQPFLVNATLYTDVRRAAAHDELTLSADYGEVCVMIDRWMEKNPCRLLETVAEKLSREILLQYGQISGIDLEIRKPEAPIPLPFGCVSVKVSRGWHRVWLGLGSNLGDRAGYLDGAVQAFQKHPLIRRIRESERIVTAPYGGVQQEDFLNSALELETLLSPEELLGLLHEIENQAGRERTVHWGPRTLDLDILFYDKLIFESDDLVIPHPDLENREFVLRPLSGLIPNYRHPLLGKTVTVMLKELNG